MFAGQFEPLKPLQPWVGKVYLQLILNKPDWFPDRSRASLVPALRDLYPHGPEDSIFQQLKDVAADEQFESDSLRRALSFALAQWGDRSIVQPMLDELQSNVDKGETMDDLYFVGKLAIAHYELREYRKSGKFWLRYLRQREALDSPATPLDYYNAACSLSLSGDIPEALAELENASKHMLSGNADPSRHIDRKLFDSDPELRAIRHTKRFRELVEKTYGDRDR